MANTRALIRRQSLRDVYAMFHDMEDPINPDCKVLLSNARKILETEKR